jgi:hypothetical protein
MRVRLEWKGDPFHSRIVNAETGEDSQLCVEEVRIDVGTKVATGERDRDRRNTEREPLHGGRDRARVEHVLAHVLAVIDAAEHEVRSLRHERFDRDHHAVRRRAIHREPTLAAPHRPEWMMQGERVARRALLAVRGNHGDLAERFGSAHQTLESVGEDPIIVRTKEPHQRSAPTENRHSAPMIRAESRTGLNWLGTMAGYRVEMGT